MASGTGAFGGIHPCRKFYVGFAECIGSAKLPQLCQLHREDYLECMHGNKKRIQMMHLYENKVNQVKAAKAGSSGVKAPPADGGGH